MTEAGRSIWPENSEETDPLTEVEKKLLDKEALRDKDEVAHREFFGGHCAIRETGKRCALMVATSIALSLGEKSFFYKTD